MTSKNTITEVIITTITKAIGKIKTPKKIIKTVMTALMRNNGGKKVKKEPYYLKMYINNINYSKEAKAVMNPVLVEVLYRVEPTTEDGKGQIIDLNDNVKSEIAQSLRISVRQVKEQISNLVESGILLYSQKQIYKLNYRYFAKGYFYRWRRYDE